MEPDSKDYQWEVPAYVLNFEFRMKEIGIGSYTAQIELREDGSVIKEIDIPCVTCDPTKLNLISLESAFKLAIAQGFAPDKAVAEIGYNKEADAFVWSFVEEISDDGLVITSKKLEIHANTGQVLSFGNSEAIR